MLSNPETLLCRYHYDPLDRLVDSAPSASSNTRRFYLKDRLATEIQGTAQRSIVQHDDQLLAQQQRRSGVVETDLLATDQQRSVLNVLGATRLNPLAYAPYGHRPADNGLLSLLGFNGEAPDPLTGCYLLGNGYRAFNPVLMRFNSPDSWSPFGKGGLNGYAYCVGDPVNRYDPTGHTPNLLKTILRSIGVMRKKTPGVNFDPLRYSEIPPKQSNQEIQSNNTASHQLIDNHSKPSKISKELNVTKQEALEHISDLRELQEQSIIKIEKLNEISDNLGKSIANHTSMQNKRRSGRPPDHAPSPYNTSKLTNIRNAIREERITHVKALYSTEKLIEKYSRYI
jgi:RHS repeat-associated protein